MNPEQLDRPIEALGTRYPRRDECRPSLWSTRRSNASAIATTNYSVSFMFPILRARPPRWQSWRYVAVTGRGPCTGIPIAIKDNYLTHDMPTKAGTSCPDITFPKEDSNAVATPARGGRDHDRQDPPA